MNLQRLMDNELKLSILVSVLIHLIIIISTSFAFKRSVYISVPVELFFYNPPRPETKAEPEQKKEEITIPKKIKPIVKKKEKKKEEVKKEVKKAETKKEVEKTDIPPKPLTPSPQVNLDAAKFPYTYYANIIRKKIGGNWRYSDDFGYYKTVIYFKIQKNGEISDIKIKESSGDEIFNQQALRAVKISSPFPPLPFDYSEDYLGVNFEFAFKE